MPGPDGPVEYTHDLIAQLELMWGEGFLSPGGREEVTRMLDGLDLNGREVLDIGCGLGTLAILLARDYGVARVVGIDVERPLIERAEGAAERAGLTERVRFELVIPGPLPFTDAAFDVVASKEAIIHVEDKPALYAEAFRVLRPGGRIVISDWYGGEPPFSEDMRFWLRSANSKFVMDTLAAGARGLEAAGFIDIEAEDRNAWYRKIARREVADLEGPKRARLVEIVGEADAEAWIERMGRKAAAVAQGDLRPGHLRARKPL